MDAKYLFAKTFVEFMDTKPIDRIRVVEVAEAAGLSKQTFYRHFVDKYDLMEYCFREMFAEPLDMIAKGLPFAQCNTAFYAKCRERRSFMHNAFSSQDVNGLFRAMRYAMRECYGKRVEAQGGRDEGDLRFLLDFYVKGVVGMTRRWLEQGMDIPLDDLVRYTSLCLPASLERYFR